MSVRPITTVHPPGCRRVVLVVGNDRDELASWVAMLRDHGFAAAAAEGARTTLRRAVQAPPDVVVLDFRGRPSSGGRAAHQIRERRAGEMPKLLVASSLSPIVLGHYLAEYDGFIARPFEPAQLLRAIRGLCGESEVAQLEEGCEPSRSVSGP
jgi:DNA-binding response OmpR family regulator